MKRKKTIELFTFENKKVCIFNKQTKKSVLLSENLAKKFDGISYIEQFEVAKYYGIIGNELFPFLNQTNQRSFTIEPKLSSKRFEILRDIVYKIILILTAILTVCAIYQEYIHRYIKHEDFKFLKDEKLYWIIIYLILTVISSIFLHEIFHTYIARKNGAFVPEIGFQTIRRVPINMFKIEIPIIIFFTRIIGKEFMTKKQQIEYLSAGMIINCLLASVSYLIVVSNPKDMIKVLCFLFFVINIFMLLSNMIPINHSDGEKILCLLNNNLTIKEKMNIILLDIKNSKGILKILNMLIISILFSIIVFPLIFFLLFIFYLI